MVQGFSYSTAGGIFPYQGSNPCPLHWQVDSEPLTTREILCAVLIGSLDHFHYLGGSDGKESSCNAGDPGSIPELGRCPGEGHGNPLQFSCLENSLDRGAWWAAVHGVTKSPDMTEQICTLQLINLQCLSCGTCIHHQSQALSICYHDYPVGHSPQKQYSNITDRPSPTRFIP